MIRILSPLLAAFLLVAGACSHKKRGPHKSERKLTYATPVTQRGVTKMTETWPAPSRSAIQAMTEKYGLPDAITEQMAVWSARGPFKRTIVYKEQINHRFPIDHSDVIEQTVNYRVPLDKITALSKFDGSLLIDRTKGELSARNEKEEMNILALNMADKIVRDEMTVEEARRAYATSADAFSTGTSGPLVTTLNFKTEGPTADPDSRAESQEEKVPEGSQLIQESEEVEKKLKD